MQSLKIEKEVSGWCYSERIKFSTWVNRGREEAEEFAFYAWQFVIVVRIKTTIPEK